MLIILVALIAFLLYFLHKIKYSKSAIPDFIPKDFKEEITELEKNKINNEYIMERIEKIEEKISKIEEQLKKQEDAISKIAEELIE